MTNVIKVNLKLFEAGSPCDLHESNENCTHLVAASLSHHTKANFIHLSCFQKLLIFYLNFVLSDHEKPQQFKIIQNTP